MIFERPKKKWPVIFRASTGCLLGVLCVVGVVAFSEPVRGADQELKAAEIHRRVSASVAIINDIDSHGSGVVLNREGLILTNYHVVASGISMSVTVDVKEAGKVVRKTFEDVEVWKVHPEYDLALIKLNYSKGVFAAAKLLGKGADVKTGSTCYAIGNPGGIGEALEHSITDGLVSAGSRKIDGLDYIQISAALNPGNSGGAVADAQAKVIGIATWKLDQSDNIGFAIPVKGIDLADFVPLQKKKANRELGIRYEKEAGRFANLAQGLVGEERVLAIHMAAVFYRKCLEAFPGHPSPYNNLGTMYFRLKEDKIAKKYLEAALKIRPNYASSLSMLGIILERSEGKPEEAMKLWYLGVTDPEGGGSASDCAENLAISFLKEKDFPRAAYCVKWANVLAAAPPRRLAIRKQIWNQSIEDLSDSQFKMLKDKVGAFSAEDLNKFSKAKSMAGRNPEDPARKDEESPSFSGMTDAGSAADGYIKIAADMLKDGAEIPAEGLVKPLPSKPSDIVMGYAGSCLIMKFPELKRLGIFDLCQAKFTKYITLSDNDAIFAAGGKVLVIYYPGENRFEFWDMESWTKRKEKAMRSEHRISAIGMGLMNHKFALVVRPKMGQPSSNKLALLSIPECKIVVPEYVQSTKGMPLPHFFAYMGDRSKIHVEETGTSALVTGSGRGFLNLANPSSVEASYLHGNNGKNAGVVIGGGNVVIGNQEVYRSRDELGLFRESEKNVGERHNRSAVAKVFGYRGVAEILKVGNQEPMLRLRSLPQLNVTFSAQLDEEVYKNVSRGIHDSQFFASAYVKRCAFVNGNNNTVTLFSIDQEADAASSAPVAPGALFKRKLSFGKGTSAKVDSGPDGLTYDAESEEISWEIPKSQARGSEVSVIFLLVDADGNESFHIEKIAIP